MRRVAVTILKALIVIVLLIVCALPFAMGW